MKQSRSCRGAMTQAQHKVPGIVACAVIVSVVMAGTMSRAWSKGGYGGPKPPTAFAPQELQLIEKCRAVARSEGEDSTPFARQCFKVRQYIYF